MAQLHWSLQFVRSVAIDSSALEFPAAIHLVLNAIGARWTSRRMLAAQTSKWNTGFGCPWIERSFLTFQKQPESKPPTIAAPDDLPAFSPANNLLTQINKVGAGKLYSTLQAEMRRRGTLRMTGWSLHHLLSLAWPLAAIFASLFVIGWRRSAFGLRLHWGAFEIEAGTGQRGIAFSKIDSIEPWRRDFARYVRPLAPFFLRSANLVLLVPCRRRAKAEGSCRSRKMKHVFLCPATSAKRRSRGSLKHAHPAAPKRPGTRCHGDFQISPEQTT